MARINEKSGDKIYHIDMTGHSLDYLRNFITDRLLPKVSLDKAVKFKILNMNLSNLPQPVLDSFKLPNRLRMQLGKTPIRISPELAKTQKAKAINEALKPLSKDIRRRGVTYEIMPNNIIKLFQGDFSSAKQSSSEKIARPQSFMTRGLSITEFIGKKKNIEQPPINVDNGNVKETFDAFNGILTSCFNNNNEAAEAFSLRVSNALDYYSNLKAMPLPTKAPESYENRQNKAENAVDFLNRVWGNYIKSGVIFRDELNSLDSKLIQAVRNYCFTKPDLDVDAVLPKDPYYRYLNVISVSHPDSQEFAEATIKIAERLKKNRQKSQNIKNAK